MVRESKGIAVGGAVRLALLGVGFGVLAWLLPTTVASASSDQLVCNYREAGIPGPRDNYLAVRTNGWPVILKRERKEIRVEAGDTPFDITHYPKFSNLRPVTCGGTQATITNIDQIRLRLVNGRNPGLLISHEDGMFSPGATGTGDSSMIEIIVNGDEGPARRPGPLSFYGSPGNDTISVVTRNGRVGLDLNGKGAGKNARPELFTRISISGFVGVGTQGNDFISAARLANLKEGSRMRVYLRGSGGNDTLIGGPGRDNIGGDHGRDLIRAMGGHDGGTGLNMNVSGGGGADRVYGGKGNDVLGGSTIRTGDAGSDQVYGGPGRDTFIQRDGALDWLRCGPGKEREVQFEIGLDILYDCEVR